MTDDEMMYLEQWDKNHQFDQKDRSVLAFTDSLVKTNNVTDEIYSELEKHFTAAEIVKLSFTVSLAGMVNRVHATFKTDIDDATVSTFAELPLCMIKQSSSSAK